MSKDQNKNMFIQLQNLKNLLPKVIVSGYASINRVIITRDKRDESKLILGVEG
jgi:type III secretion system FlhB-like substrate exporter